MIWIYPAEVPGRLLRHLGHLVLLSWIRFLAVVVVVMVLIAGAVVQGDLRERRLDHERWVADGQRLDGDGYSFRVPSAWQIDDRPAATYHDGRVFAEYAAVRVLATSGDPALLRQQYVARLTATGATAQLVAVPSIGGEPAVGAVVFSRSHAGEMLTVLVRFVAHAGASYVVTADIDQALGFKAQGVLNDMLGTWEWTGG